MRKVLRQKRFDVRFDTDFRGVIEHCASAYRPGQDGTWITPDMVEAYTELHRLGYAHSAESFLDGKLVGGCYGIHIGAVFFGESMFAEAANASKAAFLTLAQAIFEEGIKLIDSQVYTPHVKSLGGVEIPRKTYLSLLRSLLSASS
jgi:leucyl/phenylalanyl-tRNA--protein transferase